MTVVGCFYVKAYYWRGISKIKMQNMNGIVDVNKSLALDKDLFQVVIVCLQYFPMCQRYFSLHFLNV